MIRTLLFPGRLAQLEIRSTPSVTAVLVTDGLRYAVQVMEAADPGVLYQRSEIRGTRDAGTALLEDTFSGLCSGRLVPPLPDGEFWTVGTWED